MKNEKEFRSFLDSTVNLNKSRIETLQSRVAAITAFISASDWEPEISRFRTQGSWAHKTIIRPPRENGFDADLLVFVRHVPGWSAAQYVETLHSEMKASGTYGDKVGINTRCVTVTYAGDFELDLVPCVEGRSGGAGFEVCNRRDNQFEPTDAEGYTAWFMRKGDVVGRARLQESIRLLKYLRDIKGTFSCKSILLTTLVTQRINDWDTPALFADTPSALTVLLGRLDDYLQDRPALHDVRNPVQPSETFTRHWDQDKYTTFRDVIHRYRQWVDEAYVETDADESISKWQRVFGDEFAPGARASERKLAKADVVPAALGIQVPDIVSAVRQFGRNVLTLAMDRVPWMRPVPWRMRLEFAVLVRCHAHQAERDSIPMFEVESGQVLAKGLHLEFRAFTSQGLAYEQQRDFNVHWQVVNTDAAAWAEGALRGGFYRSDPRGVRWEHTQYHGAHWVQAFVVRKRDSVCVARSDRFWVVIE